MVKKKIRLGTRGSPLALAQATIVKERLGKLHGDVEVIIQVITTRGDRDLHSPLRAIGGKGIFIKELEYALQEQTIDIAVHSLKDITSQLGEGLQLTAFLEAESVRDVLLFRDPGLTFATLPAGFVLATGSVRRKALLKKLRPDLATVDIRGNVLTRLNKLQNGWADGLILSEAGLIRLDLMHRIQHRFDPQLFCPAPGQGVIALETRQEDRASIKICHSLNHEEQALKATTELAFLEAVGLGCNTPLGLYCTREDSGFALQIFVSNSTMTHFFEQRVRIPLENRIQVAKEWGEKCVEWMARHAD